MPVFCDLDRHKGKRKANLLENIGTAQYRDSLKIDEELLKANEWGAILLLDLELRHLERQHEGIECDLLGRHRAMQLIGHSGQDVRLNDVGNEKEAGQAIQQESSDYEQEKRYRSKEPAHAPTVGAPYFGMNRRLA